MMSEQAAQDGHSREWLSALCDDALSEWPDDRLDANALAQWRASQVIAEVLHGESDVDVGAQARVLARLQQVYAQDATPPVRDGDTVSTAPFVDRRPGPDQQARLASAANERVFAWPWAAVVVLAVGAWLAWPQGAPGEAVVAAGPPMTSPSQPTVLAQTTPAADLIEQAGVIRDPHLDALLQSHRQAGLGSALQYPAGFVRSVALER